MPTKRLSPKAKGISAKERARRSRLKQVGALGGRATLRKYGKAGMSAIGKKGWMAFVARHFAGDAKAAMEYVLSKSDGKHLLKAILQRENRREYPDSVGNVSDLGGIYLGHGFPSPADSDPYCDGGIDGYEPAVHF